MHKRGKKEASNYESASFILRGGGNLSINSYTKLLRHAPRYGGQAWEGGRIQGGPTYPTEGEKAVSFYVDENKRKERHKFHMISRLPLVKLGRRKRAFSKREQSTYTRRMEDRAFKGERRPAAVFYRPLAALRRQRQPLSHWSKERAAQPIRAPERKTVEEKGSG